MEFWICASDSVHLKAVDVVDDDDDDDDVIDGQCPLGTLQ